MSDLTSRTMTGPRGRGPGRPHDQEDRRTSILDNAEIVFADASFGDVSLRTVAERAEVSQAMITYYFGSKRGLFEAVYRRRAAAITKRRQELFDALFLRSKHNDVAALVEAYLRPQFEMKMNGSTGFAFLRLQARLHVETAPADIQLRRDVYDESSKRFIGALSDALPDLDVPTLQWRVTFLIGTYLYMLSGADRLDDISDGRLGADDVESLLAHLIRFVVGGLKAA